MQVSGDLFEIRVSLMALSPTEVSKLKRLIRVANDLLEGAKPAPKRVRKARQETNKRQRRTGKELVAFRKMLKAERKRGVPVADLAKQHGISMAYIYQIG